MTKGFHQSARQRFWYVSLDAAVANRTVVRRRARNFVCVITGAGVVIRTAVVNRHFCCVCVRAHQMLYTHFLTNARPTVGDG
jgi:hypothetical protein